MDYTFDWHRLLINEFPAHFLLEVVLRSGFMFITLLIVLRLTGKRGVKQLSVFEMVIIISLGSAAGDPMFYHDVGVIPAVCVFIIVISLYRIITYLAGKSVRFEHLVEGKTECLIVEGKFSVNKFERESIAHDEFFAEMRLKGVEHLGQVRNAYLETSGDVSVYFYEDKDVKPGLPIRPELFDKKIKVIERLNTYSCSRCADTLTLSAGAHKCRVCDNELWVESLRGVRVR